MINLKGTGMWHWIAIGIAILAGVIGYGFKYFGPNKTVDVVVEKVAEKIIDDETGIDINFEDNTITITDTTKTVTPVKTI